MHLIRKLVLAFGIVGFLFFGAAFVASVANPGLVEQVAKDVIRYQVEKNVRERIESIDERFLTKRAEAIAKGYADEIAISKRQLSEQLPERIAAVIAEMRNLDCECRKKIGSSLRAGTEWRILSSWRAQEHLATLIRTKYMETANKITREFRIFTGTNAFVFALLIFAVLLKRQAGLHLLPSALILLVAASFTAYLYLFNQNWLHTLVFSDYVGLAYIGYLSVAFAFLCDIIFNRARVTTELLSQFFSAVGSAVQVAPC